MKKNILAFMMCFAFGVVSNADDCYRACKICEITGAVYPCMVARRICTTAECPSLDNPLEL
jgi:hypothetical protein